MLHNAQYENDYTRRVYRVNEIRQILGIGKNQVYDLIKERQFHWVKAGVTILVSKKSFDLWLDNLQ